MAGITFDGVTKIYGDGHRAVSDLNLGVQDGEFVVLVSPSGCGKMTALRMIAGLEEISGGEIRIGERVVNNLPPRDRDVAMVFQNYALYPHKNVYENLVFGLRMRRVPKAAQKARVEEIARILGLQDMLRRKPAQLSGGQRQRVAVGRPRNRPRAEGVPDGRATVEPRRKASRPDARRDRANPANPRGDDALRHS